MYNMHKIIFSLTAHENVDCLYDLIDNIKKAFIHYDITILLSLKKSLYHSFNNKYTFVKIVTIRYDDCPIWGNINLFHQHILNIEYLIQNNIEYDFFWFVASNEMFIKIVPENFLDEYSLKIISTKNKISHTDYEIYYKNLLTTPPENEWFWMISLITKNQKPILVTEYFGHLPKIKITTSYFFVYQSCNAFCYLNM